MQIPIVDVLQQLLAEEQQGIFHYLGESGAYVCTKLAALSRPLQLMIQQHRRYESELTGMIELQGGVIPPIVVNMEMQTLAYLAVEFLLPKLIEEKKTTISRYQEAIAAAGETSADGQVLARHLAGHREDLARLESFAQRR
ncbi:MAG: hypothetical protein ABSH20_04370 [Tepidisphaeraceae bacterium]